MASRRCCRRRGSPGTCRTAPRARARVPPSPNQSRRDGTAAPSRPRGTAAGRPPAAPTDGRQAATWADRRSSPEKPTADPLPGAVPTTWLPTTDHARPDPRASTRPRSRRGVRARRPSRRRRRPPRRDRPVGRGDHEPASAAAAPALARVAPAARASRTPMHGQAPSRVWRRQLGSPTTSRAPRGPDLARRALLLAQPRAPARPLQRLHAPAGSGDPRSIRGTSRSCSGLRCSAAEPDDPPGPCSRRSRDASLTTHPVAGSIRLARGGCRQTGWSLSTTPGRGTGRRPADWSACSIRPGSRSSRCRARARRRRRSFAASYAGFNRARSSSGARVAAAGDGAPLTRWLARLGAYSAARLRVGLGLAPTRSQSDRSPAGPSSASTRQSKPRRRGPEPPAPADRHPPRRP